MKILSCIKPVADPSARLLINESKTWIKTQDLTFVASEADNYALALMAEHQLPTEPLAALFQKLMDENKSVMTYLPRWMRTTMAYASSHPATIERIKLLNHTLNLEPGKK